MIIQKYKLNLVPGGEPVTVRASQYDNLTRVITFALFKDRDIFVVPNDCKVYVLGTKEDKTGYLYECSIDHNYVAFYMRQQMTIIPGKHEAEIRIVDAEEHILNSANFIIEIEEAAFKDDTIISETDIPLLEEILEHIDAIYSVVTILQGGLEGQVLTKISNEDGAIEWHNLPVIPDKTSELENDSGFITKSVDDLINYRTSANQDIIDATKANDSEVVHKTGNETISGEKNFSTGIVTQALMTSASNKNASYSPYGIGFYYPGLSERGYLNYPIVASGQEETLATISDLVVKVINLNEHNLGFEMPATYIQGIYNIMTNCYQNNKAVSISNFYVDDGMTNIVKPGPAMIDYFPTIVFAGHDELEHECYFCWFYHGVYNESFQFIITDDDYVDYMIV